MRCIRGMLGLVGCAVVLTAVLAAAGDATAAATVPGRPLAAIAQASGIVDLLYQGANDDLWETTFASGHFGAPYDTGVGPIGSSPSVTVVPGGDGVFFIGPDGQLWESTSVDGGSWNAMQEIGMGQLGSQPAAVSWTTATGGREVDVFWTGQNGELYYTYLFPSASSWTKQVSLGSGPLQSAPTATAAAASGNLAALAVFWEGLNGSLWHTQTSTGPDSGWSTRTSIDEGTIGSPPSVAVSGAGQAMLFWKGAGNDRLYSAAETAGSWSGPAGFGGAAVSSAPTAVAAGAGTDVFYYGSDGDLYEVTDSAGTFSSPVGPGATTAPAASTSPPATTPPPTATGSGTTTTAPPSPTPGTTGTNPRRPAARRLSVKVKIGWVWRGTATRVKSVTILGLPRGGTATVSCRGDGCPRPVRGAHRFTRQHLSGLGRLLRSVTFHPGARLRIAFQAPGRRPERVQERTRAAAKPVASLLH